MTDIAIYPGSFDPPTVGHLDIIQRAAALFGQLVVAVAHNPEKRCSFTPEERTEMLRRICAGLGNVSVTAFEGPTVRFAAARGARCMVRGLRAEGDFESERALAQINRHICPDIETVFLIGRPEHTAVSSSAVREMAGCGLSLSGFVPEAIEQDILARFRP